MAADGAKPAALFSGKVDALVDNKAGDSLLLVPPPDGQLQLVMDPIVVVGKDELRLPYRLADDTGALGCERERHIIRIACIDGV